MAEQLSLSRGKTAVLIMDYQNRQLSNFSKDFQDAIIARANKVLDKARQEGIPVIYVEGRREGMPENKIHPGITPPPGELVLTKRRTGPFSTTNLDEVLKKQGIETLVLLGISTGGCVLSTVRWAYDIDYKLIVLSDCCADPDAEVHRVLTEKLFPRQASVINSADFLRAVEKIA